MKDSIRIGRVHNFVIRQGLHIAVAFVGIATSIYSIVKLNTRKKKDITLESLSERMDGIESGSSISGLVSGALAVASAVWILATYVPSNDELSLVMLIDYLSLNGIVDTNFRRLLSKFEPYRMDALRRG